MSVNVNWNLLWKRHLSQLFERKLFNSVETCDVSPNINVPIIPPVSMSSPPCVVRDSDVVNAPNVHVNHEGNYNQAMSPNIVNDAGQPQGRPGVVLRRSTRVCKKPDRLIEQD